MLRVERLTVRWVIATMATIALLLGGLLTGLYVRLGEPAAGVAAFVGAVLAGWGGTEVVAEKDGGAACWFLLAGCAATLVAGFLAR